MAADELMTATEFKALRSSLGLSAAKLAEALGVCPRSIWYWERGRKVPEPVARLARLLERAPLISKHQTS